MSNESAPPKPLPKPLPTPPVAQALVKPQTKIAGKPWSHTIPRRGANWMATHGVVGQKSWPGSGRYPSVELDGPDPNTKDPEQAVAFWLRDHAKLIVQAEQDWKIDRRAIAGAIAWEAIENSQSALGKSFGPGKNHSVGESGHKSWAEAVEASGRLPRLSQYERERYLKTPEGAIKYIGAIMDMIATVAEHSGFDARKTPEILGFAYQGRWVDDWKKDMEKNPPNHVFEVPPGSMGAWIIQNQKYLEANVGQPTF